MSPAQIVAMGKDAAELDRLALAIAKKAAELARLSAKLDALNAKINRNVKAAALTVVDTNH
ncbi:hypothetical protein [Aeromonas caviae]|uniref:hypothetical protein n=1 Tax=Aeromonas caviae TaxID=648 RepID=UPI002B491107|nr:hypothetical protein [Aeromonas caviae]